MDIDSYLATSVVAGDNSQDFPTGADPAAALERAKKWLEGQARDYFKKNPGALTSKRVDAGNILATGPDGPEESPTATLFVSKNGKGQIEFEWNE